MGFWAEQVVPRLADTMKLARDARPPPSGLSGCRQVVATGSSWG